MNLDGISPAEQQKFMGLLQEIEIKSAQTRLLMEVIHVLIFALDHLIKDK